MSNTPAAPRQFIVEIVSDSGEGAQKAGQIFATVAAKQGYGVWTVEIIPAEIKPPSRSRAGASGIRIRLGNGPVTNMGDEADLVVAFNEQVLYGRIDQRAYRPGTVVLLEDRWKTDRSKGAREEYGQGLADFARLEYDVREVPFEQTCLEHTATPRLGKNMLVLGVLCRILNFEIQYAIDEMSLVFRRKKEKVRDINRALLLAGAAFAEEHLPELLIDLGKPPERGEIVVMNGNQAVGLGVMASGMDLVSMYPITPATSASHYLAEGLPKVGGVVHQAEDEIAAIGFAIGSSFAGKTACTITSGPGLALKTEFLGLAVMAEVPLVMVVVQRGGPSTGLPTKVEQGDLLAALYGATGDAPKVIMAPATIEECLHMVVTARKLAEAFRTPVLLLTDANLATGVQPFPRPKIQADWLAGPNDQSAWRAGVPPYDWDAETGLSPRPIPGQAGGEYTLTGLAHTPASKVAYDPDSNQSGCEMRSRKLAALQRTLRQPEINGEPDADLLVVGWGSTLGAITEAVDQARSNGLSVASMHLRSLSPLPPGLPELFKRFRKVMTVEINYSDPASFGARGSTRRAAQLALVLRAETLLDVDYWSLVHGQPLQPRQVLQAIKSSLSELKEGVACSA